MLTGVLVDVSGSMQHNLQLNVEPTDHHLTRAESIFSTIINIAERAVDCQDNQKIFALAFGLEDVSTCDLLSLLDYARTLKRQPRVHRRDSLIRLLANNGAPYANDYVQKYISEEEAEILFQAYSENINELQKLIQELPYVCKYGAVNFVGKGSFIGWSEAKSFHETEKEVTREHADCAMKQAKDMIHKHTVARLRMMSQPKTKTLKSTIDLLHEVAETSSSSSSSTRKSLSAVQLSELVDSIKPYIYGGTPMCEALTSALNMFKKCSAQNRNVLFLLSDGESTDGTPVQYAQQLRDNNVLVLVCFLTSDNVSHPRRLYYDPDPQWTRAQRDMFELSSTIENNDSAMSVLLERGWELPPSSHSRLFVQANHPEVIDEFSSLVRHMAESNDALLNIFGRVSLDIYINETNSTFKAKEQIGQTCYANAVAAVLHLAMCRIKDREGGIPDFYKVREQLIDEYGKEGANTEKVLSTWAPKYRLKYKIVDELGARKAINERRPVVATFSLYKEQWTAFSKFFEDRPKGILETEDLGTHSSLTERGGHAVVLIKCDPESLTFMNSWGTTFADKGFFKVRNQSVLNLIFYDVYWTLKDLKISEKMEFQLKGRETGQKIAQNLPVSVKNLPYECPKCHQLSRAVEFIGHLWEATCPK